MAYDKVVDSAFLEAGLKKVGDSIRAKAGTSELLEFPDAMSAAVDAIDTSKPEQTKTATPSLSQQTIVPDNGKTLSGVTVNPITSALLTSLDADFTAANIAKDVNMFGLIGTLAASAGMQVATGTVIASLEYDEDNDTLSYAFSVSGLSFSPRVVAMFANEDWYNASYTPGHPESTDPWVDFAILVDFNTNKGMRVTMGFSDVDKFSNLYGTTYTNTGELAKTANGFVAEDDDVNEVDFYDPVFNAKYVWYAFG